MPRRHGDGDLSAVAHERVIVGLRPDRANHSVRRADIQGLRAIAVMSVVVNHLTGHPQGGFVGVDVFFVISGFLITSQLLRDVPAGGGPGAYIGNFYRRRIRRLLPASLLVIGLTVLATRWLTGAGRYVPVEHDAGWAAVFWANWHFSAIGTNYFTAAQPPSPLQHYWSLSVEEQFYLLWPVVLFLAVRLGARRLRNRAAAAVTVAVVISLGSYWFGYVQSYSGPTAAYFSTFTRGWELGLGAALAAAMPHLRVPRRLAAPMSLAGVVLIVVSLFSTRSGQGFPVPGAQLPCLGTALALAAYNPGGATRNVLLTNRLSVFIGDISYSVYLVHFPIIILLQTKLPHRDGYFYTTAVCATVGAAVLLYALVEQPVLRSRWLLSGPHRRARRRRLAHQRQMVAIGLAACLAGVGSYLAWPGDGGHYAAEYRQIQQALPSPSASQGSSASQVSSASSAASATRPPPLPPQLAHLTGQIQAALSAHHYPKLTPTMESVIAGPQATQPFVHCALIDLQSPEGCTWGDPHAPHTIYLTGDSTSMVYAEALAHIVEHTPGWKLRFAGAYGCRFSADKFTSPLEALQNGCPTHVDGVTAEIERTRPDVLMVSNAYHNDSLVGHADIVTPQRYVDSVARQLAKVRRFVGHIVVLAPPPGGTNPADCYHPGREPIACVYRPPTRWQQTAPIMRSMVTSAGGSYVDSIAWFCNAAQYCPPFVGHTPVMHDQTHSSPAYMNLIWPVIKESLLRAGALP